MMTCPGGVFHWSLGLMGEGNQPKYVCVCLCKIECVRHATVYDGVFTPGPVLWCCDAECHPALAWALKPEKPAVKLTGLSSALTYTVSSPVHSHTCTDTYTCNIMRHTYRHTHFHGLRFKYTCTHKTPSSPPLHIHTYPQTITQAAGSLSHASYKHSAKGICLQSSDI